MPAQMRLPMDHPDVVQDQVNTLRPIPAVLIQITPIDSVRPPPNLRLNFSDSHHHGGLLGGQIGISSTVKAVRSADP